MFVTATESAHLYILFISALPNQYGTTLSSSQVTNEMDFYCTYILTFIYYASCIIIFEHVDRIGPLYPLYMAYVLPTAIILKGVFIKIILDHLARVILPVVSN